MRKRTTNLSMTYLCIAFVALTWTGCSKSGSNKNPGVVTYLSLIHGAPYAGAVNFYLNDTLRSPNPIATGAFSQLYGTVLPGMYAAKFEKAGTDSVLDKLTASTYDTLNFYTLLLYNDAGGKAAHALKIFDNFSGVSMNGNAYYRFFHLSPDYSSVNVYFNNTLVQSHRSPADNAVNNALNAFQPVPEGTYTITVADAATDSVIAISAPSALYQGHSYSVWITGLRSARNAVVNVLQAQSAKP
jgi:hypothetical protein